jgi:hypothetical protein
MSKKPSLSPTRAQILVTVLFVSKLYFIKNEVIV